MERNGPFGLGPKPTPRRKMWMGSQPDRCQICSTPFSTVFIDGRTAFGSWALMCPCCHRDQAIGLGTGEGQKYNFETLEKIDG
jgi:hypothetical protein